MRNPFKPILMINKAGLLLFPLFVLSFNSIAVETKCTSLNQIQWILGKWQTEKTIDRETIIKERWIKVSDKTFEGLGQVVDTQGNLKSQETLRLVNLSGEIYFIAKVTENPLPISFKAAKCDGKSVWLENHEHDFPQQIIYSHSDKGLNARVQNKDGKGFTVDFRRDEE